MLQLEQQAQILMQILKDAEAEMHRRQKEEEEELFRELGGSPNHGPR